MDLPTIQHLVTGAKKKIANEKITVGDTIMMDTNRILARSQGDLDTKHYQYIANR